MCTNKKSGISIVLLVLLPAAMSLAALSDQPANTWVKRSPLPDGPVSPRLGYEGACVWDSTHNLLMRYGGHNQGGGGAQYSEMWTYDPLTGVWTLKEPDISPPGVCCAQQNVYDPVHQRYVRFPAFSGSHGWQWFREIYLNNSTVWVYSLEENRWRDLRPVPAPHVAGLRCASWDSDAQVIVIFGGEGNREGTVVYDPHANTWTRMKLDTEPPLRSGGNMAYDAARKLHVLFGAQFSDDPHTWGYSLRDNKWTDLEPATSPPTNQNDAVLTYDSLNKVVIAIVKITEGQDENATHTLQTWAYDAGANAWTRMNPPREPDSSSNRSRVLCFAPEFGLAVLENRTRSEPGPAEQQIWTYCYARPEGKANPDPPAELHLTTRNKSVVLNWKPSPSSAVTGYAVYRGEAEKPWNVDYRRIASLEVDRNGYEDTQVDRGKLYFYFVRALAGERRSDASQKVRTQSRVVEDVVVSVLSETQAKLRWKAPDCDDIVGYHVERATVEVYTDDQLTRLKSHLQPLAAPSVGAVRTIGAFKRLTDSMLSDPLFVDTVDLGTPIPVDGEPAFESTFYAEHLDMAGRSYPYAVYAYRISAVNALGVESGPSPYFLTIPSPVRFLFSRETDTTCNLKWAANPEENLRGYRVYRLDGRWDKDPISRLTPDPVDALVFSDSGAGDNTRRYHVVAVDALGQEGAPSRPVWHEREWKRFYEPFTGQWHQ